MKHLQLEFTSTGRAVHPIDQSIVDLDGVSRESIVHLNARPEDLTILYELRGDAERLEAALAAHDTVIEYELVTGDSDEFSAYIQVAAAESESALLSMAHHHALIIDTPIDTTPTGLAVTLIGTHENLHQALTTLADDITATVMNAGPYAPSGTGQLSDLTERQLEVFQTAVAEGYYDVPRQATQQDIASELGCAPSTIDEHLRKAEARVVTGIVG